MARARPVRDQLLQEVRKRHRAAGQKVSRLERKGIRVRMAGLDPRRSQGEISGMDARQLRSYLRQLNSFTDRGTSFVAGRNGAPINKSLFQEYKRRENKFNSVAANYLGRIRDIKIPGMGLTIGQRLNNLNQSPRAGGDFKTFDQLNRQAAGLKDDLSVKKLLKSIDKKLAPNYFEKEMSSMRRVLGKMLEGTGNLDLIDDVNSLSDDQLNILTGYTDFMNQVGFRYDVSKSVSEDAPRYQSSVFETSGERARSLLDWANNLPTGNVKNATSGVAKPTRANTKARNTPRQQR